MNIYNKKHNKKNRQAKKTGKNKPQKNTGKDLLISSPSPVTEETLGRYYIAHAVDATDNGIVVEEAKDDKAV